MEPLLTSGCDECHNLNNSIEPHVKESVEDCNYVENRTHEYKCDLNKDAVLMYLYSKEKCKISMTKG